MDLPECNEYAHLKEALLDHLTESAELSYTIRSWGQEILVLLRQTCELAEAAIKDDPL